MRELETHTLKAENKSHQDFLLAHQAVLHQALQSLKEDLHSSYSLLLGPSSSCHQSITLTQMPKAGGQPLSTISPKTESEWSPPQRGDIHQWKDWETCQWMKISLCPHRRNRWTPRKVGQLTGSPP